METLLSEHGFSLRFIFLSLEIEAALALMEAMASRINPKAATGYVDRAIDEARDAARAECEAAFEIIPTPTPNPTPSL